MMTVRGSRGMIAPAQRFIAQFKTGLCQGCTRSFRLISGCILRRTDAVLLRFPTPAPRSYVVSGATGSAGTVRKISGKNAQNSSVAGNQNIFEGLLFQFFQKRMRTADHGFCGFYRGRSRKHFRKCPVQGHARPQQIVMCIFISTEIGLNQAFIYADFRFRNIPKDGRRFDCAPKRACIDCVKVQVRMMGYQNRAHLLRLRDACFIERHLHPFLIFGWNERTVPRSGFSNGMKEPSLVTLSVGYRSSCSSGSGWIPRRR